MPKKLIIKWDTGKEEKEYNLLNEDYLNRVGISDTNNIKSVTPFFAFPEKLYTEEGIASNHHPCIGSGGAEIETNDGKRALIEEIFYFDYGHKNGEYKGIAHYNKEGRFTDTAGKVDKTCDVEDHIIDNPTDHMDISLITISGNKKQTISGW